MDVRRLTAELFGTYVLVLGGTTAILSATASGATTRVVLIALAFGLALMAGLYAFGEVSGGHFNPAVSLAMLWVNCWPECRGWKEKCMPCWYCRWWMNRW